MTFSSPPGEGLGAVKSTSLENILKTKYWSTDVTDGKPLVTVLIARALRGLLRKVIATWRAKQSHERPEGLTLRAVHCLSLSPIWDYKEHWALKNWYFWTVVLEKTLESPLDCKEIQPVNPKGRSVLGVHWKDWCWSWNSSTLATWYEELTHLKRPWWRERLRAGGEGDNRGWDGWIASPTQWTWIWVNSRSWWWTGRPGVLWFMGSQRVRHDWATELN